MPVVQHTKPHRRAANFSLESEECVSSGVGTRRSWLTVTLIVTKVCVCRGSVRSDLEKLVRMLAATGSGR
eukprot:2851352-Rhodomonas_salina.3